MPFPNPATQFQPGRSGNPGGCPSGRSITARLRDLLEKGEINGVPIENGKQAADLIAEVILREASNGDFRYVGMILDRTEGKVADKPPLPPDPAKPPRLILPTRDARYDEPEPSED